MAATVEETGDRDAILAIRSALAGIVDPCSIATGIPINLLDMGLVESISVVGGTATLVLVLTSPLCWQSSNIRAAIEDGVLAVEGIDEVVVRVNHHGQWDPDRIAASAARLRRRRAPRPAVSGYVRTISEPHQNASDA
jgi:metal-sulfur cluster biosynthetic enzyme